MFPRTVLIGFILLYIGCESDKNQDSSDLGHTLLRNTSTTGSVKDLKYEIFHQDLNKSYQQLAGRPWVLAKSQNPYQDINLSVPPE